MIKYWLHALLTALPELITIPTPCSRVQLPPVSTRNTEGLEDLSDRDVIKRPEVSEDKDHKTG